jgi:PAS domain S-box-containing protein
MIRADQANEELGLELQRLRKRVSELESFHTERPLGGETLQQIEAKSILESYSEGLLVLDKKGRLIDTNKTLEAISGYHRSELVGKTTLSLARLLTNKGLSVYWKNPLNKTFDNNRAPHEVDIFKKNGGLVTVQTVCQELREDNNVVGHLVILKDVTKCRRAERESNASLEVYRSLVNHVGIGIFRSTAGPAGRFLQVNHALEKITGYSREELLQMNVEDLYVHPEERIEHIKEVLSGMPTKAREVRFKKKDGTEIIVRDQKIAVRSNDGKALYLEGFIEDISERKRAEAQLQLSETKYSTLVEKGSDGVVIVQDGIVRFANSRTVDIIGFIPDELIGRSFIDFVSPAYQLLTKDNYGKRIKGEKVPGKYEIEIISKDGRYIPVEVNASAIEYEGKPAVMTVIRDITESKQAQEKLKTSEKNLQNSLDSSPIGIRISDKDDHTSYVNQAFLDVFGYANLDEVRNSPPWKHYTCDAYASYILRHEKFVRGEPMPEHVEIDIQHKDGSIRHLDVSMNEILWDNRQQYQTLYNDITQQKQAEQLLQASEKNLRNSLDNSPMGIYIIDADQNTLYANQALLDIFDYQNLDELRANPLDAHYSPESRVALGQRRERYLRGEPNPDKFEIDIARKDGTTRRLLAYRKEILWNGKKQRQVIYNDITERKQTEQALQASEENFRNSMNSSLMGIRIVDAEWHTLYVNRVFLDIFGFKNMDEVNSTSLQDRYTPEERVRYLQRQEKLARGESVPDSPSVEIVGKDGAIHVIKVYLKEVLWDGKQQRQMTYQDVTDLQQAEKALKASEQNFRNSMDSSLMGIRIMGDHDYTIYANQALLDMFGYQNIEELRASPPQEHYTPESHAAFIQRKDRFARGESLPEQLEFDIIRKDGAIRHLHLFSKEVLWNGQKQYQFFYNDITERRQAEEELKASEQNLHNFLDNSVMGIRIRTDGYIEYVNQAMLDIFGCENIDELRAKPPEERYTPESQADFLTRKEKISQGEPVSRQIEVDIVRKDGTIRHLQVFGRQVIWKGKTQTQTFYNDLSERKALEANNAYLATFPEMNADPILELDLEGNLKYLNPAGKRIFPDLSTLGLKHPLLEDWAEITKQIRHSKLVQPIIHEVSFSNSFYEQAYVPVNEKRIRIYCRDVTKRKRAENQVKESEENLRAYLENAPDGIYMSDLKGCFLYGNKKAEEILGYEKEELIGSNFLKLNVLPAKYLAKAGKLLALNAMGRNTGPDEFELMRKDKTLAWVEISTALIKQKDKKVVIGFVREIGERKRVEERLKQAANEWRTTFDSISDLIMIHDKDNRIIRVNKAAADMLKTTPKELLGKFCHEAMHGTKEPPLNCPHLRTIISGKSSELETFNSIVGVHFQESASPMFNEKGEITGSVIVARDVTQQKRIEEQLVMTDRLASIGELSSGIAHELNNPLTSVIGFSQLMMEGDVPANMKEDLGIVNSEAQRAAAIVKNLLTFARKHAPVKQLSQVNTVIEDVLRLRAYEQKVNNIEIENHLAPNLPEIMIDHFQMQQVFLNIMVNAEFAMLEAHHRGKLVVTTEKLESIIKISFADDGPGISKENLKHIFDPFFTTKEVGKGTGLGLSICHGIVTEHSGKIYATSEKGRGATFIVELPLINEQ